MNQLEPYNFIFELPLYTKIDIDKSNATDFIKLMLASGSIEGYNPVLKQETTYHITKSPSRSLFREGQRDIKSYKGFREFEVVCVRNNFTITIYTYINVISEHDDEYKEIITECFIEKIGQYPSTATLHISKIKQYDKVLPSDKLKEITKGIGLAANGVGIGSFVYLRRVFEFLIEEAHKEAIKDAFWIEDEYNKSRIAEKIDLLKNHLPVFLIENKSIYSILSKGIHELEENECLQYFDALKVGVELILDEKEEQYRKQKKIEDAKNRIQLINQKIKTKK